MELLKDNFTKEDSQRSQRSCWLGWPFPCHLGTAPLPHSAAGPPLPFYPFFLSYFTSPSCCPSCPSWDSTMWALSFLTAFLHVQTVTAYSSWLTCRCFQLLDASFLSLSLNKSFLFINAGFLLPFLDFLLLRLDHCWVWRTWYLKINQLSRHLFSPEPYNK